MKSNISSNKGKILEIHMPIDVYNSSRVKFLPWDDFTVEQAGEYLAGGKASVKDIIKEIGKEEFYEGVQKELILRQSIRIFKLDRIPPEWIINL